MKDATGELSMTAVAVVAIAAIAVVFTTLIWPRIKVNIMRSTYCSQAFGCKKETEDGMRTCYYCTDEGSDGGGNTGTCGSTAEIKCPIE